MWNNCDQYVIKYQQLLRDLKSTIESLLVSQVVNVWSIYGGLTRLHSCLEKIFKHGCKCTEFGPTSFYDFIQGLEWLQPDATKSDCSIDCEFHPHMPNSIKDDKAAIWLYHNLEKHSLSQKLAWLLSDRSHLLKCYQSYAFLAQEKYAESILICLRAVERNQVSLLSEINPCLFLLQSNAKEFLKIHRRCSSFPDDHLKAFAGEAKTKPLNVLVEDLKGGERKWIKGKLKPWHSMPSLKANNLKFVREIKVQSRTTPSTPIHAKKQITSSLRADYKFVQPVKTRKSSLKKHSNKGDRRHVIIDNCNIVEHTPPLSSSQSSGGHGSVDVLMNRSLNVLPESKNLAHSPSRLVGSFLPLAGEKDLRRKPKKSFFDDGGISVLPMATGYFPRPIKGQSLLSFLTSGQFARANAELDRENAHFSISEALISAMEEIQYKKTMRVVDEQNDDSDPEIVYLKQRIRLRKNQKLFEKQRRAYHESLLSDGKTDTATSVSPCSTTPDTLSDNGSSNEDDIDDLDINSSAQLNENTLSVSMASLYSDVDLFKRQQRGAPDGSSDVFSAEGVALSLISKFSEKQLPRASDLEWLVTEEEAPQALLPMPQSWPISPVEADVTLLRGTQEWAPPRPQIIFTMHPPNLRKQAMSRQNYRCAGCSMKVAPQYASRFRYCDYLGRSFCTGCHMNQLALIPGRVIHKWDFTRYPVSSFSYKLLDRMYFDPLFRIFDLNKTICKISKNLDFCRRYRLGLYYLKDFIYSCRFAQHISEVLEREKAYLLTDPEVYSMDDLVSVRSGDLKARLKELVEICCRHTSECNLCLARGFICEICNVDEVIFPWQLRRVKRCDKCGMCYHANCWLISEKVCLKCKRIDRRRESQGSSSSCYE